MNTSLARSLLVFGSLSMAVATGLGAWASHGLDGVLEASALSSFQTGVNYQFFHSLGLLAVALLRQRHSQSRALALGSILLVAGIVLFCGGVYAASFDGPGLIRRLAPIGGISLIAGWVAIAAGVLLNRNSE